MAITNFKGVMHGLPMSCRKFPSQSTQGYVVRVTVTETARYRDMVQCTCKYAALCDNMFLYFYAIPTS